MITFKNDKLYVDGKLMSDDHYCLGNKVVDAVMRSAGDILLKPVSKSFVEELTGQEENWWWRLSTVERKNLTSLSWLPDGIWSPQNGRELRNPEEVTTYSQLPFVGAFLYMLPNMFLFKKGQRTKSILVSDPRDELRSLKIAPKSGLMIDGCYSLYARDVAHIMCSIARTVNKAPAEFDDAGKLTRIGPYMINPKLDSDTLNIFGIFGRRLNESLADSKVVTDNLSTLDPACVNMFLGGTVSCGTWIQYFRKEDKRTFRVRNSDVEDAFIGYANRICDHLKLIRNAYDKDVAAMKEFKEMHGSIKLMNKLTENSPE